MKLQDMDRRTVRTSTDPLIPVRVAPGTDLWRDPRRRRLSNKALARIEIGCLVLAVIGSAACLVIAVFGASGAL